ncbi:apoptosis inducing factor mitochondria associated 4 [Carcharodon carcharias]|uniref:apoptosis inducing factor mitochondria associated 4 n=1 Tax=Carcharodon carcharias TaxID=13397 RepID=UPI001B7D9116|nr:apoptosis inducing factor mitochondria associated 4 [Carcharodon carcharias]
MGASRSRSVDLRTLPDTGAKEHELHGVRHTYQSKVKEEPETMFEKEVCLATEMQDEEMREVEIKNHKVLLIKSNGEFSAIGHLCSHYGSPLVKGVLSHGRVRCPRHGACFNIKTGDIEEFPCVDGLQRFKVEVQDGKVILSISAKILELNKRTQDMVTRSPGNKGVILLIGGGPASLICAETLRQEGYKGRVILATKEMHLPYDRPKLSKSLNSQVENILLRKAEFYSTYDIEVLTNKEVLLLNMVMEENHPKRFIAIGEKIALILQATSVNTKKRKVRFKDGTTQQYDNLLIATGSIPKMLDCPGADLENVCLLRTPEDANKIDELATGKNVVIVGSSFIGMEVAAYLAEKAKSVSVIGTSEVPYQNVLGIEIGKAIMKMFEQEAIKFYMLDHVTELRGEDGLLKEVVLASGKVLPSDICVVGIGVTPATSFLNGSPIKTDSKGTVVVDQFMQTSVAKVFAAGDITSFPLPLQNNQSVNIGHWQLAHMQGHVAALNMQKKNTGINTVPFFWTHFFGKSLRYAGYGTGYEEVIFQGDIGELKFAAFYIKEDKVVAVASLNYDPVVAQVAEVLASGKTISKSEAEYVAFKNELALT